VDLRSIARTLGGEVAGNQVLCPGPGHRPKDRCLSIRLSAASPGGFIVHSFASDDWRDCRDYVKQHLGLPIDGWGTKQKQALHQPFTGMSKIPGLVKLEAEASDQRALASAGRIARKSVPLIGTLGEQYLRDTQMPSPTFSRGRTPLVGMTRSISINRAIRFMAKRLVALSGS
jgi:putative DNA primase/helicase